MSILRITVRTFQSEDHANLFLMAGQNVITSQMRKSGLKFNAKIIQNPDQKNQITSIWEYDDENHMKEVRGYLSKNNSMPNSLSPKEVVYYGEVKLDSNKE